MQSVRPHLAILVAVLSAVTVSSFGCRDKGEVETELESVVFDSDIPVRKSLTRADARACDSGNVRACADLGLAIDEAVKQNDADVGEAVECFAHSLHERACDEREPRGCYGLGRHYYHGICVEADQDIGLKLLNLSCGDEYVHACRLLESLQAAHH